MTLLTLKEVVPEAVDLIADVPISGAGASVKARDLLRAVEQLRERPELFPYTYRVSTAFARGGGISGIRLPGDDVHTYFGDARMSNEGELVKMAPREGGAGIVERRDIRHVKEIETANMGTVKILRRRAASRLRAEMEAIKEFAAAAGDGEIEKSGSA
jgi:hypothetical protein